MHENKIKKKQQHLLYLFKSAFLNVFPELFCLSGHVKSSPCSLLESSDTVDMFESLRGFLIVNVNESVHGFLTCGSESKYLWGLLRDKSNIGGGGGGGS